MNDSNFLIVNAKPDLEQAQCYAELENIAANGGSALLYGQKWKHLLAHLYLQHDSSHSYQFTRFAISESAIVGHITCFPFTRKSPNQELTKEYINDYLQWRSIRPSFITLLRRLTGVQLGQMMVEGDLYIGSFAVVSKFRGQGIGSMLINQAEQTALKYQVQSLSLEVSKVNKVAIDIYLYWGFNIEEDMGWKDRGVFLMRKHLK